MSSSTSATPRGSRIVHAAWRMKGAAHFVLSRTRRFLAGRRRLPQQRKNRLGAKFEASGVQVGETVPPLSVYTMGAEKTDLRTIWRDRPAVLIQGSVTCTHVRRRMKELDRFVRRLPSEVAAVVLYTTEAHPMGGRSPYAAGEWELSENQMAGIRCAEPRTLDERIGLARDLQRRTGIRVPILVDSLDNTAWRALGGGANTAVLVDQEGVVLHKQGWFDPSSMAGMIGELMGACAGARIRARSTGRSPETE